MGTTIATWTVLLVAGSLLLGTLALFLAMALHALAYVALVAFRLGGAIRRAMGSS